MARARALPGDLRFVLEAEALKRLPRAGWRRVGIRGGESVADHSWRLAVMAMLYADLLGLDAERAMRIALLHDLAEARVGDAMPGEWSPRQKHAREARALRSMLRPLPPRLARRYLALWHDYESGRSPEARLVHELDKLEMAAQAGAYEGSVPRPELDGFWRTADRALAHPALRQRFEALQGRRPGARPQGRGKSSARANSSGDV
jgi:putative hydrolase of HD superfamily